MSARGWVADEFPGASAARRPHGRRLSRRLFMSGLGLAALSACGPAPSNPSPAPAANPAPAAQQPVASQPQPVPAAPAAQAPAAPAGGQPKRGGTYRSATTTEAVTLHPYKSTDTASGGYIGNLYTGGMFRRDPETLQPVPNLAERWEIGDDKLTYVWHLRQDVKWSDGKLMTTEDWLWTFQQAANPDNKFPYRSSSIDPIADISAPDAYTLVVKIKEPLVVGLEQADPPAPLPRHVWEKYDWNDPAKNPEIMAPTVVSGPYKLKEWQRDDHAIFTANDLYWRGRPYIDEMLIRIVPDANVSYQMLKTGEVDSGVVQPNDFEEAKANPLLRLYQWEPAAAGWDYIGFNLRRPIVGDARVRHAIAYAINRDAISKVVYNNLAKPTYSNYPPTSWVYNPDVPRYDYNPKQAAAELDAAGWTLPAGASVRVKDGQPLKLKLLFGPNTSKVREQIAVIAQQALQEIGVDITVQGMEWGAFLQTIKSEPFDWDLNILGWSVSIDPHWSKDIWDEKTIPSLNNYAYVNKRVEELYEQGGREFDEAKRKAIYGEIQKIIATDSPVVFLVYQTGWTFRHKRVHPNEPTRLGIGYEFEKWWLDEG